jgi:UDP-N-acetyl-D-mannosaminuronate dehydrogenase
MEIFYKITKEQAELIGRFYYAKDKAFDPFVSEQKDGTYLLSEKMYLVLKDHANFKKINFDEIQKIDETKVDPKEIEEPGVIEKALYRMRILKIKDVEYKDNPDAPVIVVKSTWWQRFKTWLGKVFALKK